MTATITLGTPNYADDLRLPPQARKVLAHLKEGKSITPSKAQTIYSIWRLAARIKELRDAGYKVVTEYRQDEQGHRYGCYWLATGMN